MTAAIEIEVHDAGAPLLDGQEGGAEQAVPDPYADIAAAVVPGWTQAEAARVIGGMVAGLTTALYLVRYQAPPAPELVPAIAGQPEQEFPLLGMSLAPILDLIAPKGSAAAIGVGLGAGISEVMGAMVRRMPVLSTPPPDRRPAAPPHAAAPPADAAAAGDGFRYRGPELEVLRRAETSPLTGLGLD